MTAFKTTIIFYIIYNTYPLFQPYFMYKEENMDLFKPKKEPSIQVRINGSLYS